MELGERVGELRTHDPSSPLGPIFEKQNADLEIFYSLKMSLTSWTKMIRVELSNGLLGSMVVW